MRSPRLATLLGVLAVAVAISSPATASAITVISPGNGRVVRIGETIHFRWTLSSGESGVRVFFVGASETRSSDWTSIDNGEPLDLATNGAVNIPTNHNDAVGTYVWRLCVFHIGKPTTECEFTPTRRLLLTHARKHKTRPKKHAQPGLPTMTLSEGRRAISEFASWFASSYDEEHPGANLHTHIGECGRHGASGLRISVLACQMDIPIAAKSEVCWSIAVAKPERGGMRFGRIYVKDDGELKCPFEDEGEAGAGEFAVGEVRPHAGSP